MLRSSRRPRLERIEAPHPSRRRLRPLLRMRRINTHILRKSARPSRPTAPWYFSSNSSAGVMPRATNSSQRPQIARLVAAVAVELACGARARASTAAASPAPASSTLRSRISALKPSLGTSSRSFWRSSAVQSFTISQPASSAVVVVEQADPERRQRRQPPPRSAVGAAHFEIALEPHFGEDRARVVGPVRDGRPLARQIGKLAGEEDRGTTCPATSIYLSPRLTKYIGTSSA